MSDAEPGEKKSLKKRVADSLHPPQSEQARQAAEAAAHHASLAMETLVDLLSSEDEGMRLKAAQLILGQPHAQAAKAAPAPAIEVIEKLSKKL